MEAEWLVSLAASGGAALVAAAATDAWQNTKNGFQRLLGRGDVARQVVTARRLDQTAAEVEQAPPQEREQVRVRLQEQWRTRLTDLLEEDPAAAERLRVLTDEVQRSLPSAQQRWVQNVTASAPHASAQGAIFGNIINHSSVTPTTDSPG